MFAAVFGLALVGHLREIAAALAITHFVFQEIEARPGSAGCRLALDILNHESAEKPELTCLQDEKLLARADEFAAAPESRSNRR